MSNWEATVRIVVELEYVGTVTYDEQARLVKEVVQGSIRSVASQVEAELGTLLVPK